jgi:hypothetical protein
MKVRIALTIGTVVAVATVHGGCGSSHAIRVENATRDSLFVWGTSGSFSETTGYEFVGPDSSEEVKLGGKRPDLVHFYFNYPRNADGSPAGLDPDWPGRRFSCTWEQVKSTEPLVVTHGDPPCGVTNVSPP